MRSAPVWDPRPSASPASVTCRAGGAGCTASARSIRHHTASCVGLLGSHTGRRRLCAGRPLAVVCGFRQQPRTHLDDAVACRPRLDVGFDGQIPGRLPGGLDHDRRLLAFDLQNVPQPKSDTGQDGAGSAASQGSHSGGRGDDAVAVGRPRLLGFGTVTLRPPAGIVAVGFVDVGVSVVGGGSGRGVVHSIEVACGRVGIGAHLSTVPPRRALRSELPGVRRRPGAAQAEGGRRGRRAVRPGGARGASSNR
jgi:hypothetical protein